MIPAGIHVQRWPGRCRGVILLTVIFVMVVLGLLAALLTENLSGQYAVSNLAQLSRQADYAARSGIEWGRERAVQGGICGNAQISVADFTVDVRCTTLQVTEGAAIYNMFDLDAVAQRGTYGNPDFVRRSMQDRFNNR